MLSIFQFRLHFHYIRGMLHVGEFKFHPGVSFVVFFRDTRTSHLGLKSENFHLVVEMNILTFLHDILNVFIL